LIDYKKLYYKTLIELAELKIKSNIDVNENIEILKNTIIESLKESENNLTYLEELSKREMEVLELLLRGLATAEIAEKLFLSKNTAKKHIYNILAKANVKNRTELLILGNQEK